jgi:hypothetical protein
VVEHQVNELPATGDPGGGRRKRRLLSPGDTALIKQLPVSVDRLIAIKRDCNLVERLVSIDKS